MHHKIHSIIFSWIEKHYLVKHYLICFFVCFQFFIIVFFHDNLLLFYGYLFSCILSLPLYISIFLLLEKDFFKPQPFVQNMSFEELCERYKCNPKIVKHKYESSLIHVLKSEHQYYNDMGKKLNSIVIYYFSHTSFFVIVGINLNVWLIGYIIIFYLLQYKIKQKKRYGHLKKGRKVRSK